MELVTALHKHYREARKPYRIVFQPDPVCWTEAPETFRGLARQRDRWQRGTLQVLSAQLADVRNPRYGVLGLFVVPYYVVFEGIGPIIELLGYVLTIVGVCFGLINWRFCRIVVPGGGALRSHDFAGLGDSRGSIVPSIPSTQRPAGARPLRGARELRVPATATWWRARGVFRFLRGHREWGTMTRKGFEKAMKLLLAEDEPDVQLIARLSLSVRGFRSSRSTMVSRCSNAWAKKLQTRSCSTG